ncbi:unnamed protein product [Prorocentrum cordatum]|uniref:Anaphase-promoting complex subunit 1 n=1 Tax=Prorocentrum cordatum TaxID=2364126 RepID=A0ABN9WS41_9DINO|nr:unnamed protein product [Polarella glacialis]
MPLLWPPSARTSSHHSSTPFSKLFGERSGKRVWGQSAWGLWSPVSPVPGPKQHDDVVDVDLAVRLWRLARSADGRAEAAALCKVQCVPEVVLAWGGPGVMLTSMMYRLATPFSWRRMPRMLDRPVASKPVKDWACSPTVLMWAPGQMLIFTSPFSSAAVHPSTATPDPGRTWAKYSCAFFHTATTIFPPPVSANSASATIGRLPFLLICLGVVMPRNLPQKSKRLSGRSARIPQLVCLEKLGLAASAMRAEATEFIPAPFNPVCQTYSGSNASTAPPSPMGSSLSISSGGSLAVASARLPAADLSALLLSQATPPPPPGLDVPAAPLAGLRAIEEPNPAEDRFPRTPTGGGHAYVRLFPRRRCSAAPSSPGS